MTLIAFHAHGETAGVVADTLSYTATGRRTGYTSKVRTLPHLRSVVASQGNSQFGHLSFSCLCDLGWESRDFDELLTIAPDILRSVWEEGNYPAGTEAATFMVGWSPHAEEFVSYALDAKSNFEPSPISGPFIIPTPYSLRPSALEMDRLQGVLNAQSLDDWDRKPELPAPQTPEEWVHLAVTAYEHRSLHRSNARVFIGGSLFYTELTLNAQGTYRLYDFDQTGEHFDKMVAGTLHPRAQLAPCSCDSGKAFMDCCLDLDETCCDGKPIRDCCLLTPAERAALAS